MKRFRSGMFCLAVIMLLSPAFTTLSRAESQDDDLKNRIRLLEIQIQQLKALKEQQKQVDEKEQQCLKAVGNSKFCKCVSEALTKDVSFEQYVHFLVTPKEGLKYDTMPPESRQAVDTSIAAHDKCVDKGWFK